LDGVVTVKVAHARLAGAHVVIKRRRGIDPRFCCSAHGRSWPILLQKSKN
jgi:hypothetical protein